MISLNLFPLVVFLQMHAVVRIQKLSKYYYVQCIVVVYSVYLCMWNAKFSTVGVFQLAPRIRVKNLISFKLQVILRGLSHTTLRVTYSIAC